MIQYHWGSSFYICFGLLYFQCACPDCTISYMTESQVFTVHLNELSLPEDKHLPCHINIKVEDVLLYKMPAIFVLNLMLWPTLLFIIGFVGLFSSCLLLQYESCIFLSWLKWSFYFIWLKNSFNVNWLCQVFTEPKMSQTQTLKNNILYLRATKNTVKV